MPHLAQALVPYRENDFAQAARELAAFTGRYNGLQQLPVTLSGTVRNTAGEPVAGVAVAEFHVRSEGDYMVLSPTQFRATTDATGTYRVSGVPLSARTLILRAFKPGYFSGTAGRRISAQLLVDFRLTPATRVALEDVVKGTVQPGDGVCGTSSAPCRVFGVSMPRSGTLDVSLVTPIRDKMDLWVETAGGDLYSPRSPNVPLRLAVPVFAGSRCQISVVANDNEPHPFELTMRLR